MRDALFVIKGKKEKTIKGIRSEVNHVCKRPDLRKEFDKKWNLDERQGDLRLVVTKQLAHDMSF